MATITQTINARYLEEKYRHAREERGTGREILQGVALFFATPFLGLAYAVSYGAIGLTALVCYGLKAFGVQCGVFKS